jgi:tetratricopeptide (TPR) repeat protein
LTLRLLVGALMLASAVEAGQPARKTPAAQPPGPSPAAAPSVPALLQLARRHRAAGDAAAALESLRQARTIAPNSEEVLSAFAQVALAARMLMPAIVTLDALTRICPTVAQYRYLLGVAFMEGGDMPAASDSLAEANRLEPERPLTLLALGLAFNGRQQFAEAKAALRHSLELDPESIDTIAALAEAEAGSGDLQQAEQHAQRVLVRASGHATAHLVMGLVLMQQERYADARAALEAAVAADATSPAAHYQLSLACARLGDEAASQAHVELYRQKRRQIEERIKDLRRATIGPVPGEPR